MSFIFQDQQLLEKFLEIVKVGQPANAAAIQGLAQKLISNLSRTMDGGISEITSGTKSAATISNLNSLNSLLKFLTDNKIEVDGKRAAYTKEEFAAGSIPDEEKRNLGTITGETLQEVDSRKIGTDYWVNVPVLVDYLQHLQDRGVKDEASGNVQRGKLLQIMSENLLKKVQHPSIGGDISHPATKPGAETAPLPDTTVVDGFGLKTFDDRNPLDTTTTIKGQVPLTLGDLKSRATLDNWLKQGTSYVVVYDGQGKKSALEYGTEGADPCVIIHVLHRRARDKQNQFAGDPKRKREADAYLQAVQNVSQQFTGLDGKPCSISSSEIKKPEEATSTQSGAITRDQQAAISQSIMLLPFEQGRVSFSRIKQFFSVVNSLPLPAEAVTNMQQALEAMSVATGLTTTGETTFNLDEPVEQYKYILKDPQTGRTTKAWGVPLSLLMDALMKVIFHTRQVIVYFWQHYQSPIGSSNERKVLSQIGKSPTDYSLYQQNYIVLHRQIPTAR